MGRPTHNKWKERLTDAWAKWEPAIEAARLSGSQALELDFPKVYDQEPRTWVEHIPDWICRKRGLGDFARFALARYLHVAGFKGRAFRPAQDVAAAQALTTEAWSVELEQHDVAYAKCVCQNLSAFDTQLRAEFSKGSLAVEDAATRLRVLTRRTGSWEAMAAVANAHIQHRRQAGARPVTAAGLRDRRFAGPTAVEDFIVYLNTGIVPARQATHPDDLRDLGVHAGDGSRQFVHCVPYFPSEDRQKIVGDLAEYAAAPATTPMFRVSCLWSQVEPHGLIAACRELVARYAERCIQTQARRLPVVYVPVGLDMRAPRVSRRAIVRDLHRRLCVERGGQHGPIAELAADATGEQIDTAIGLIRDCLAHRPTFLIFGIHHVEPDAAVRPISEEILDSPLPYLLDRLMPETGSYDALIPPADAYATHALVLADGELPRFSNFDVHCVQLPACSADYFAELLKWTQCPRVAALCQQRRLPDVVSNEIELSVLESLLFVAGPEGTMTIDTAVVDQAIGLIWGERARPSGPPRIAELLRVVLDHICEQARSSVAYAWFATALQITALAAGGLRRETAARVLAGYAVATGSSDDASRPTWQLQLEAPLWRPPTTAARLSKEQTEMLCREVVGHLDNFEVQAGAHIRTLGNTQTAGLDEYPHPYESPEVPAFAFEFDDGKRVMELRYPLVQIELRRQLAERCLQKHTLLQRLIADEFIRRAVIVQRHGTQRDQLSLVERRYAISAVHHGLDSLAYDRDHLLSREGKLRARWLMEPSAPILTYYWIYRWLYVEQINNGGHELSRQHGAEVLKIALLGQFLTTEPEPERILKRFSLRSFVVRSEILQGLVHAGLRGCDHARAIEAMEELQTLCSDARRTFGGPELADDPEQQRTRLRQVSRGELEATKLRLDGAVMYGLAFAGAGCGSGAWRLKTLVGAVLATLAHESSDRQAFADARREMRRAVFDNQQREPPFASLIEAARAARRKLSSATAQVLYDYLLRYAELIGHSAERLANFSRRFRHQKRALILFELAEALRKGAPGSDESERVLQLSARPVRNASRLCLTLGNSLHSQPMSVKARLAGRTDVAWFFERATYYAFHFIGNHSHYQVERVASLIIEASTIRIRGRLGGRPRLDVAMNVLKAAERALIHYPNRVELWMRFYLERARLFHDRVLQLGSGTPDAAACATYCLADIASVIRLAQNRELWVSRAQRVLDSLPAEFVTPPASPSPAAGPPQIPARSPPRSA